MGTRSQNIEAVAWIVLTGFLIVSINTIARLLSTDFHPFQLVFFYSALGLCMYMPLAARNHFSIRTTQTKLYLIRALLEFLGFSLLFYGLTLMPLPVHTALSFTSPLFAALAAVIFLREPSSVHRWVALLVGFVGVLIVTRPGFTGFGVAGMVVVGAALCFSLCMVCIKKLTKTEPCARIAFYMLAYTALIALPFAMFEWRMPQWEHVPYILLLGVLVALVQFSVSQAFAKADVTIITPFWFMNLLWSSLYAFLVFDEIVDLWTILGGAVILNAAFYALHHARKAQLTANSMALAEVTQTAA